MEKRKLTILQADNTMDKFYHALVMATEARTLGWDVNVFVTSQAVVLLAKGEKGSKARSKLSIGGLARFFVQRQMKKLGITNIDTLLKRAIDAGVQFFVDEAGLKIAKVSKEELMENVKLSGGISFLLSAKDSDVVVTL
jgi:predicted peroxiredoxin